MKEIQRNKEWMVFFPGKTKQNKDEIPNFNFFDQQEKRLKPLEHLNLTSAQHTIVESNEKPERDCFV